MWLRTGGTQRIVAPKRIVARRNDGHATSSPQSSVARVTIGAPRLTDVPGLTDEPMSVSQLLTTASRSR